MSFKIFAQILIIATLLCLVSSQTQFTGSLTITNDPNMGAGALVTVEPIYYDSDNQIVRYDFPNLRDPSGRTNGFTEIFDFKNQVYFQLCSNCSTFTNSLPLPKFFKETNDIKAPVQTNKLAFTQNGQVCDPFQKQNVLNGGISFVWVTASGTICRAERTDGTTYNFNNIKPGAPAASLFTVSSERKCPDLPKCGSPIDLVLVLDESGSIHREEWAQLIRFATGIVNSFVVGPNDTQIGLVFFSGVQYATGEDPASCCGLSDPALPLSFDADTINKFLLNHKQTGGHTCINCGIKTATTYEPNRNRPIDVPKLMLVLSDGFNNRMTDFFLLDIENAKNQGWNMFSIGVANASLVELNQIASSPDQVFKIDNFDALETIAKSVTYKLCGAYPTLTPCGPICKGKCGCGGQCMCPDICLSPDPCTNGTCTQGVSGSECLFTPKFCDPLETNGDLCKLNTCNKQTGNCNLVTKNCSLLLPDSCYSQVCDSRIGCTLIDSCPPIQNQPGTNITSLCFNRICTNAQCTVTQKNCTDRNACAVQSCDPTLGCVSSPINCDDGNMCTTDTCDRVTGCVNTKIDCPSKDFFNTTNFKNNPCLQFSCDPKVGCTSSPKTCDDANVCTTDTCDPANGACINTAVVCQAPTDKCQVVSCDPKGGCITANKTCDDNNFCTTDSCIPETGACSNTPITCPALNGTAAQCNENVCDSAARKCILKPKLVCPAATGKCVVNVCTPGASTPSCVAGTAAFICPLTDLCSTSSCDPTLGCINNPKNCNDNNNCTRDSCDPSTGSCVNTPIPGCNTTTPCTNCTSTNPCLTVSCVSGACITTPFNCPINKCATVTPTPVNGVCQCIPSNPIVCAVPNSNVCGDNVCDPATGLCGTVNNRVCDDRDPCTTDTCIVVSGRATCNFTQITCPGDSPCSRKRCVATNGVPSCVNDPAINTLNCTSNDCSVGQCNPNSGKCEFTSTNCANPSNTTCARNVCNPVTSKCEAVAGLICPPIDPVGCGKDGVCVFVGGVQTCKYNPTCVESENGCISSSCKVLANGTFCESKSFNCDDNNPCTTDTCVPDGVDDKGKPKSKCNSVPVVCPGNADPCKLNLCVNVGGLGVCQATEVVCNSTSKCIIGKCVNENGRGVCKFNETNCGVPDRCTNFACEPSTGCKKISKCDDGNPCTNDLCDPVTGLCTFTNKVCNSTNLCRKGVCDPNVGCVEQPIDCAKDRNVTALDACHFAVCVNTTGCSIAIVPNSLDACGLCNQPGKCAIGRKSKVPAGAIAGAVIGGAIIAGILALGIGLFCASTGAASFTAGTQPQMVGGSNNPLYTDGDTGGTNPFDDNDYVPL